jgi:predicted O-methyltransferase YrrM
MDLIYKKDKNGKDILCNEDERHQIMMEWEKPYMEKSIELLNPFGKVLEIGFGLGYSATKICSFKNVKEYNVIECTPIVWEKFEEFKNKQQNARPELKINLIKGRWEDVLQTTETFDSIYFDDYVLNSDMDVGSRRITHNRGSHFLQKVLQNYTRIGSRISFYSGVNIIEMYKNISCIRVECSEYKIDIPSDCKYAKGDKMYIPIITKTSNAELDLKDKLITANNTANSIQKINPEIEEQVKKEMEKRTKYKRLFDDIQVRGPSCGLIVIDNFYKNPHETRKYILTQEFSVRGNYPGQRTVSYATQHLKDIIQGYVMPFGGKITDFPIPDENNNKSNANIYNGSFQYTTSRDRSWVHIDGYNNWGGVLYMTPNAPLSSGTAFYKFNDGATCQRDQDILENKTDTDTYSQDMTKWQLVDRAGNVFNRLILFNSKRFHMSMDYFGDSKENGRLFQVFFFSTEK